MSKQKSPMDPAKADTLKEPSATSVIDTPAQAPANATDPELPAAERYAAEIDKELKKMSEKKTGSEGVEERIEAEFIQKIFEATDKKAARGEPTGWERE